MIKDYKISKFVKIIDGKIFDGAGRVFTSEKTSGLSEFLKKAYSELKVNYPKFHKMDSYCKLGILASEVLFRNTEVNPETALIFLNSSSSLETDLMHQESLDSIVSPSIFVYTLPNIVMGEISIKYNLYTENAFFISDKFDQELLITYSSALLESQKAGEVVCGWFECKNDEYDVFLCLISGKGDLSFTGEKLEELYNYNNE